MLSMPIETTRPAQARKLIPYLRELPADLETPVSVYLKLAGSGPSFLLESVTGGEQLARYSFIGVDPGKSFVLRGRSIEEQTAAGSSTLELEPGQDPLACLRRQLASLEFTPIHGLPRFSGGLVGYLGYETMTHFEPSVAALPHTPDEDNPLPDAIFLLADTVVAFDHAFGRLLLITNIPAGDENDPQARAEADARLDDLQARLEQPLPSRPRPVVPDGGTFESNTTREAFEAAVLQAKEHIAAGDIFQVVLSQRISRQTGAAPFDIYRALRRLNPSPYMFFFDFDGLVGAQPFYLIGASPEMHVRLEGRTAFLRPIAGTRPRGQTPAADAALAADLLSDPKERAEHVMLVDLARNDLGRVCRPGSVQVSELMNVEHYSHVMHIVSQVQGELKGEYDAFDLLRVTFPAGTVSGAPKIRAMQIIAALEGSRRNTYAGAVGYFSFDGSMDTCITIRTLAMQGSRVSIQSGAGIVADSVPASEYQETINKARALAAAVEMAEKG